jgi:hypothetical protein
MIVGGVPAKPIRERFPKAVAERLRALAWWDWEHAGLRPRWRISGRSMSRRFWKSTKPS